MDGEFLNLNSPRQTRMHLFARQCRTLGWLRAASVLRTWLGCYRALYLGSKPVVSSPTVLLQASAKGLLAPTVGTCEENSITSAETWKAHPVHLKREPSPHTLAILCRAAVATGIGLSAPWTCFLKPSRAKLVRRREPRNSSGCVRVARV